MSELKCDECDFETTQAVDLTSHSAEIHGLLLQSPHCLLNKDDPAKKMKCFKCPSCTYSTSNKSHLKDHMKAVHLKIRDQTCPHCDYATSCAANLQRHFRMRHTGGASNKPTEDGTEEKVPAQNNLGCPPCTYSTSNKSHLKDHMKAVHLKIRDQNCPHCNYATSCAANLQRHIRMRHTGGASNKPAEDGTEEKVPAKNNLGCPSCTYSTSNKSHLKDHIKAIHLMIRDQNCPHCNYATSRTGNLQRHLRMRHRGGASNILTEDRTEEKALAKKTSGALSVPL